MEEEWLAPYLDRLEETSQRFFRYFHDRVSQEGGLSQSQFFLLKRLAGKESCTVSDMAHQLQVSVAGATGLIDRLVRAGLVIRKRDQVDRRVVRIMLSPDGVAQLARTRELRRAVLAELCGKLTPNEAEQLVALHEKMTAALPVHRCERCREED